MPGFQRYSFEPTGRTVTVAVTSPDGGTLSREVPEYVLRYVAHDARTGQPVFDGSGGYLFPQAAFVSVEAGGLTDAQIVERLYEPAVQLTMAALVEHLRSQGVE
jgi:hypothetical protein